MRIFLASCLLLLCGCGLFGVHQEIDPVTGKPVITVDGGGGIIGKVFSFAGLPWVGTAIAALGGIYADTKRRNWKGVATQTVAAVEDFKSDSAKETWKVLKAKLTSKHSKKSAAIVDSITKSA